MSADRRFERALPGILADLGAGPTDDYSQLLARTARTRQRPAWSFLERWLPMDIAVRPAPAVITPRRLAALVALLLLASLVGIGLLAGSRPSVPPPFGLARNGSIVYSDPQGRIWLGDPVTLKSRVLVDSPDNDEALFSPDGGRLLYTHHRGPSDVDIIVARADGSEPRVITPSPIGGTGLMQWAPDSRSIVLAIGGTTRILRYDADRQADPTVLADDPDESLRIGERSIAQVQHVFRPPAGNEVLTIGRTKGHDTLIVTSLDGGQKTVIFDDPTFEDIINATWSSDGNRIAFNGARTGERYPYHTWIIDSDGSGLRRLFRGLPGPHRPKCAVVSRRPIDRHPALVQRRTGRRECPSHHDRRPRHGRLPRGGRSPPERVPGVRLVA